MQTIRHSYARQYMEFEKVIQQTAMILSGLTSYTSIAMGTDMLDATLKHIQLLPLSERSAVAILVTNTGHVENRKIAVPEQISVYEMEQLVNLLNDKLSGVSMIQLSQRLYTEMAAEMQKHMRNYENLLSVVEQVLEGGQEDMVFLEGAAHIFAQPEFRDVEKVKSLFELLDKEERIQDILSVTKVEDGIQVRIGHENSEEAMADCSIITAAYTLNGRPAGSLSILGPTRMDYQKVISIMDYVTRDLSSWLDKMYRSE
jgi:heat-inducible transcriptional repressor